jgi:hypothetical protein
MFINIIDYLNQIVPPNFIDSPQISVQTKDNLIIILNKDYLSDLFSYIYFRYINYYNEDTEDEVLIPLSSVILRKKYGKKYMFYIQYLLNESYIRKVKNHNAGSNCNTYKLVKMKVDMVGLVEYENRNKKLIRYHNRNIWNTESNSSIYSNKIINTIKKNLKSITIDRVEAIEYLRSVYPDHLSNKYLKNYHSIISIDGGNLYMKSDKHGRIHTNLTILKKDIKNQFLRIDGEVIKEKDISNSQALFFLHLLSKNLNIIIDKYELYSFQIHIIDGTIYDHLANKSKQTRENIKNQFFKYLFGGKNSEFKVFNGLYPSISKYIKAYKVKLGDYKLLSHQLQLIEGDFIFNIVCKELMKKRIKYFTVHDSVCVRESDFNIMDSIFEQKLSELKSTIQKNIDRYFEE